MGSNSRLNQGQWLDWSNIWIPLKWANNGPKWCVLGKLSRVTSVSHYIFASRTNLDSGPPFTEICFTHNDVLDTNIFEFQILQFSYSNKTAKKFYCFVKTTSFSCLYFGIVQQEKPFCCWKFYLSFSVHSHFFGFCKYFDFITLYYTLIQLHYVNKH